MPELAVPRLIFGAALYIDVTLSRGILRLPQMRGSRDTQGEFEAHDAIVGPPVGVSCGRGAVVHDIELCY
jgi:hypothetical protein